MASRWENAGQIVVVLITIFTLYVQFIGQNVMTTSIIYLGLIIAVVPIYFLINYIWDKFNQITKLAKKVEDIEKKVDYMNNIHELDKRVAILEKPEVKNKRKGQLDPRIILLILLFVLFFLYLRSAGILK